MKKLCIRWEEVEKAEKENHKKQRKHGLAKRLTAFGLTCVMLFVTGVAANNYTLEQVNYPIYINGEQKTTDKPVLNLDGSTYVPLRFMSENAGMEVNWDAEQGIQVYDMYKYHGIVVSAFSQLVMTLDNMAFSNMTAYSNEFTVSNPTHSGDLESFQSYKNNIPDLYIHLDNIRKVPIDILSSFSSSYEEFLQSTESILDEMLNLVIAMQNDTLDSSSIANKSYELTQKCLELRSSVSFSEQLLIEFFAE